MATVSRKLKDIKQIKKDNQNIAKVSNELLESFIKKNNSTGLKLLMYMMKESLLDQESLAQMPHNDLPIKFSFKTKDFLDYFQMDIKTLKKNILSIQDISVSIKDDKAESYINVLPRVTFTYKGNIDVQIYPEVINLVFALDRYSIIDISTFTRLESKHAIRMLMLLERIANFSKNVGKRKHYELDELNLMFGTRYKTFTEFDRAVLTPAKAELDSNSKLSFLYEIDKDKLDKTQRGRASCTHCTIDLVKNKYYQPSLEGMK